MTLATAALELVLILPGILVVAIVISAVFAFVGLVYSPMYRRREYHEEPATAEKTAADLLSAYAYHGHVDLLASTQPLHSSPDNTNTKTASAPSSKGGSNGGSTLKPKPGSLGHVIRQMVQEAVTSELKLRQRLAAAKHSASS